MHKMKTFSVAFFMAIINFFTNVNFYDIKFESIDGTIIKTSSYQGKKCIIAVVSANASSVNLVRYLDSIQKGNTNVQVIAIPTGEFDGSVSIQDLKNLKKNLSIIVAKPLKVRKLNASLQHPLFVWLTQDTENKHFNKEILYTCYADNAILALYFSQGFQNITL